MNRMNSKQIRDENDWVDSFGVGIRPTIKMHETDEEGALESSTHHVIAIIQEQGASEDFFWEEILGKRLYLSRDFSSSPKPNWPFFLVWKTWEIS